MLAAIPASIFVTASSKTSISLRSPASGLPAGSPTNAPSSAAVVAQFSEGERLFAAGGFDCDVDRDSVQFHLVHRDTRYPHVRDHFVPVRVQILDPGFVHSEAHLDRVRVTGRRIVVRMDVGRKD